MTILCTTDFSPCSQSALMLAESLARRLGDRLVLLHVVQQPASTLPSPEMLLPAWTLALTEAATARLTSAAREITDRGGIAVDTRVLLGDPALGIHQTTAEVEPRLLVMGTHGRKGVARLFLGSVASTVVRKSNVPVLVTGAIPVDTGHWSGGDALRLVVGLDGSRASESALAWLNVSGQALHHERVLVRLFWPPQEALRYGLEDAWQDREPHPQLVQLVDRDLRHQLQGMGAERDAQVRFRAAHVNAAEVLASEAGATDADAVVVGVPKHRLDSWHALPVTDMLRNASRPVLCIPEQKAVAPRTIPMIRAVLVASDLSEVSRAAIPRAYALLHDGGGRVELVHVHETHPIDGAFPDSPTRSPLNAETRLDLQRKLNAMIPEDAEARGIFTHVSVVEGPTAAEALMQAADRLDVDVLALGSHGRSGIRRAVLGSVAEQVARHSPRPVLIIHSAAD